MHVKQVSPIYVDMLYSYDASDGNDGRSAFDLVFALETNVE